MHRCALHYRRDYDEQKAVVVVWTSLPGLPIKRETRYTRKYLRGLGNLYLNAAYNHGRLTLICWHHFVQLTVKGGWQSKKCGIIKISIRYRFNSNKHTHMFLFVTQASWVFILRIWFFLVCNLGLFEITEWEPCMWLLRTDILAGYAARQSHCW